jgi:hypothetical protein
MAEEVHEVLHAGELWKRGRLLKSWKRKHVVLLSDGFLYWGAQPMAADTAPAGVRRALRAFKRLPVWACELPADGPAFGDGRWQMVGRGPGGALAAGDGGREGLGGGGGGGDSGDSGNSSPRAPQGWPA